MLDFPKAAPKSKDLLNDSHGLSASETQGSAAEPGPGLFKQFDDLLMFAGGLPGLVKRDYKTLLEIAEVHRKEIACSNILGFFLKPNEQHGLGSLALTSLLECLGANLDPLDLRSADVSREHYTETGKKLDILVVGETFVIGIENKIDAALYNPLDEYNKLLEDRAAGNPRKEIYRVVLGLFPESSRCGFKPVTYETFFQRLLNHIGEKVVNSNQRHLLYLFDFIATIQNLKEETHMAKEMLKYINQDREEPAMRFYVELNRLADFLRSQTKLIVDGQPGIEVPGCFVGPKYYSSLKDGDDSERKICDCFYCDALLGNGVKIRVEAKVAINTGWQIYACNEPDRAHPAKVTRWLGLAGLKPIREEAENWIYAEFKERDGHEGEIRSKYQELLDTISMKLQKFDLLKELIRQTPDLYLDDCENHYVRFAVKDWKTSRSLTEGKDWTNSRLMLLFEFDCFTLNLGLVIGPGPEKTQSRIFSLRQRNKRVFRDADEKLGRPDNWTVIFRTPLLSKDDFNDEHQTEKVMRYRWADFLKNSFPPLKNAIKAERKLWET